MLGWRPSSRKNGFEIHPLLRQYAAQMLSGDPASEKEAQARHASYFTDWMVVTSDKLKGSEQLSALTALRSEAQFPPTDSSSNFTPSRRNSTASILGTYICVSAGK